jgi:hypothetical protein
LHCDCDGICKYFRGRIYKASGYLFAVKCTQFGERRTGNFVCYEKKTLQK